MNVALILEKLNLVGIQVEVDAGDLVLTAVDISAEQITYLRDHKAELVAHLVARQTSLEEVLSIACHGLSITPDGLRDALAPADIEDWRNGRLSAETLTVFAESLLQQRDMAAGIVPPTYTKKVVCKCCGPVWLWIEGKVDGCPWCFHRAAGQPIPRPTSIHCGDCMHFQRIGHRNLGHCAKGEPEAIAGLWDSSPRHCDFYQSEKHQKSCT